MKTYWTFVLVLVALAGLVLQSNLGAGDKKAKEPEKKKAAPVKPVVISDEWINADLKDKVYSNSFCKTYTYKMEKDKSYQIELSANNYRACLRLENSSGTQVGMDFDRFGNQAATIIHRAGKTEDYEIVATSLNPNLKAKFTLTVKELTGDEGKPIELKMEKGLGSYAGNLVRGDPRYSGKIHKLFLVKLQEGKTYQIDLKSGAFDAYLYLQDPDGKVLAEDDDSGGGLNSRIIHRAAKSGEYRIVATSLGGTSTGQFTLSVKENK
jgi:hypothetical protein